MKLGLNITIIIIVCVVCVTGLCLFAMSKGIDGILLAGTIGAILGVPTWFISKKVTEIKANKK